MPPFASSGVWMVGSIRKATRSTHCHGKLLLAGSVRKLLFVALMRARSSKPI